MALATDGINESNISAVEKGNISLPLSSNPTIDLTQRVLAEFIGMYIIMFAGCGSIVVNKLYGGNVTFPGICLVWGLIVMAMIYTLGHVSAHFNPVVTIALALLGLFPFKEVFIYIVSQLLGGILASGTVALIIDITPKAYFGTKPSGSIMQSFVAEIIVTFILMFIVSGATNDPRANKKYGGIVVGMTVTLNVLVAGPISGGSMNPARTLGPAIVCHNYKGLWVYFVGPLIGAIAGGYFYNLFKPTNKSFNELFKRS
ncbi:hypothetical protein L1887_08362 [Cichorium endivia]|nr:hypothetical protein L1887_08362 [Cichorium endivia]